MRHAAHPGTGSSPDSCGARMLPSRARMLVVSLVSLVSAGASGDTGETGDTRVGRHQETDADEVGEVRDRCRAFRCERYEADAHPGQSKDQSK